MRHFMITCLSPESPVSISAGCQAVIFGHFKLLIYENKKLANNFLIQNIYSSYIGDVFARIYWLFCIYFLSMECLLSKSAR